MNTTGPPLNISDVASDNPPRIVFSVFLSLIAVTGSTGNVLVIIVTLMDRKLWSSISHVLIAALSFTDLIICLVFLPMSVIRLLNIDNNLRVCFYVSFLSPIMTILSTQIQALLAIVRYKITVSYNKLSDLFSRAVYGVLAGCVIFDLMVYCSFVVPPGGIRYISSLGVCSRRVPVFSGQPLSFVVLFYFSALTAVVFYIKLRSYIAQFSFSMTRRRQRQNRLSILLSRLFISWATGYTVVILIRLCDKDKDYPDLVYQAAYFVLWCNSCVNPIFYNSNNKTFAKAFSNLRHKLTKAQKESPEVSLNSKSDSSNNQLMSNSPNNHPV